MAATGFTGWLSEHKKVEDLQAQIVELKKQEMRSAVMRSVSAQMEEIANEQREISDEKSEEALRQTKVANEMRLRSEKERQNALEAERNAVASEKKALEASALAESQRKVAEEQQLLAEHQRIQAEFSKRKADTLSYIALGRSLGSIATFQAEDGNDDMADLLSYASYLYTSRYRGDIYYPAVFQSLILSSQSKMSWSEHIGAVMNLEYIAGNDNVLVSASNYGEIILSERKNNRLLSKVLYKNKEFDFRDMLTDTLTGNMYAVSRTGHLVMISKDLKNVKTIELDEIEHPMRVHLLNKDLLVIGERAIAKIDPERLTVNVVRPLPFRVTLGGAKDHCPLLFDDEGRMHLVKGIDNYETKKVPVAGKVTAYCQSKNTSSEAYGMSEGTIWVLDKGGVAKKLVGHRSRISKMKLYGNRLLSASYDGNLNLWIADREKVEPMPLLTINNWIMHFCFDSKKNSLWVGDAQGNLTSVNISVPYMVGIIKKKLKRNLTTEEWNYYIGENVPYESFIASQGKEATP